VLIFKSCLSSLFPLQQCSSYWKFAHAYSPFSKLQPEVTKGIYDQFMSQLQTLMQQEINLIKEEGNLEELLSELDCIVEEGKDNTESAWRPSGVPEEDLRSFLVRYCLQQREYLRKALREVEEENAKLAQSVLAGRERIAEMQWQIQRRKEAWQEISKFQKELISELEEPQ
uniref:Polyamine modulated factor 1 n=1 Tax=Latimeria chalumnae TaxID=7897 RepID=H3B2W5_LATCH